VLPLSKGLQSPTGEPMLNSPSCVPGSGTKLPVAAPAPGGEAIPTPRQSPEASRPANGRYGAEEPSDGVKQVRYLAPPLETPGTSGK
jgi:hypothetical protein